MSSINGMEQFDEETLKTDPNAWTMYVERFDHFLASLEVTDDRLKVVHLLHKVGPKGFRRLRSLAKPVNPAALTYAELCGRARVFYQKMSFNQLLVTAQKLEATARDSRQQPQAEIHRKLYKSRRQRSCRYCGAGGHSTSDCSIRSKPQPPQTNYKPPQTNYKPPQTNYNPPQTNYTQTAPSYQQYVPPPPSYQQYVPQNAFVYKEYRPSNQQNAPLYQQYATPTPTFLEGNRSMPGHFQQPTPAPYDIHRHRQQNYNNMGRLEGAPVGAPPGTISKWVTVVTPALLIVVTLMCAFIKPGGGTAYSKRTNIYFSFCLLFLGFSHWTLTYWYRQGDVAPKVRFLEYANTALMVLLCCCALHYIFEA